MSRPDIQPRAFRVASQLNVADQESLVFGSCEVSPSGSVAWCFSIGETVPMATSLLTVPRVGRCCSVPLALSSRAAGARVPSPEVKQVLFAKNASSCFTSATVEPGPGSGESFLSHEKIICLQIDNIKNVASLTDQKGKLLRRCGFLFCFKGCLPDCMC